MGSGIMFNVYDYRKIIIVGSPGSGKSFFAKHLGQAAGLSVIHLDNEFWHPDWVETPREEWIEKQKRIINGAEWIIDGDYSGTLELRFAAAELVIFLDVNPMLCIYRAARRTGKKRSDLPEVLQEPKMLSREFFDFAKEIWQYPKKGRKKVLALHEKYRDKPFLHIKSRHELQKYLYHKE